MMMPGVSTKTFRGKILRRHTDAIINHFHLCPPLVSVKRISTAAGEGRERLDKNHRYAQALEATAAQAV
jgi:hypothetical protein